MTTSSKNTITAWRIVRRRYADTAFDGEGARLFDGRWNSRGTAVVYTGDSHALSLLEVMVHVESYEQLEDRVAIPVRFSEGDVEVLSETTLPTDWRVSPPSRSTQEIGDAWVRKQRSLALKVPSVISPHDFNYIFNPRHPRFSEAELGAAENLVVDPRLIKK